ncbi:MAG: Cof-type HAD-IIB family hydrolase [Candidatus Cohnella colombiensis]|uniref:Cof-type HAD-IIB family hydrolase n=1 Tax=Candidatus Cohnella colombiensis TaxID=3121368 RepID=A0AA95EU15_9BACL|nr:MAG: Cof-type HAD-IIB family hydrolase [Cohnella sp.]
MSDKEWGIGLAYHMGKYKLLALDLDGTLLNDRSEISESNALWVQRALDAGIVVCVSTGRGFLSALPFAEQIGKDTPMLTVNGGEVWRKPHQLHRRTLLAAEKVMKLHALAEQHKTWYWAYTVEDIYNNERWPADTIGRNWLKFGFHIEDSEKINTILEEIRTWEGLELSNSSIYNIEVNGAGVSKATGLEELCRLYGFNMSEVVAIGDSLNDIAAIRAAGLGIAMGNAQDEVKAAANVITEHHQQDGVAYAIEHYVLKSN